MLALCSMLSRTYYANFNASIICAPLAVKRSVLPANLMLSQMKYAA